MNYRVLYGGVTGEDDNMGQLEEPYHLWKQVSPLCNLNLHIKGGRYCRKSLFINQISIQANRKEKKNGNINESVHSVYFN